MLLQTFDGSMMTVGTKLRKMWLQSVRTVVLLKATSSSSMASSSRRSASLWRYSKEASWWKQMNKTDDDDDDDDIWFNFFSCIYLFIIWVIPKTSEFNLKRQCKDSFFQLLSYLCDQIWVADNGSHKETVIRNLGAHFHTGCTQVQVHLVVGTWDGS